MVNHWTRRVVAWSGRGRVELIQPAATFGGRIPAAGSCCPPDAAGDPIRGVDRRQSVHPQAALCARCSSWGRLVAVNLRCADRVTSSRSVRSTMSQPSSSRSHSGLEAHHSGRRQRGKRGHWVGQFQVVWPARPCQGGAAAQAWLFNQLNTTPTISATTSVLTDNAVTAPTRNGSATAPRVPMMSPAFARSTVQSFGQKRSDSQVGGLRWGCPGDRCQGVRWGPDRAWSSFRALMAKIAMSGWASASPTAMMLNCPA